MLQRGFLRLSKRKKSPTSSVSSIDSERTNQDEWTKYDERLIDAAYKSDREKIKETIRKKGVSPVKVSRDGQTALHISVKKGMNDCVDFMLVEQPDLSTIDLQGRTVYHISASKGDPLMLKKLLNYSRWNLEVKDTKEMTALHYAVASGENECVKLLLDNNAPVDLRDGEGRTPLLTSIVNGYEKIAMTLILHGVDVNAADYKERTPIIMACIQGMRDVVALLISKGADSKIVDTEGKTLEMVAADAGHSDIVDILRNSADSGIMDIDHMNESEDNVEVEEKEEVDFHKNEDDKIIEEKDQNGISEKEDDEVIVEEVQLQNKPESTKSKRRSILKSDDSSLTTSIIESLMGYEVSSETINESETESKEKFEQERQEMQYEIAQRDQRIEELQLEINSLKQKLRWETEMRFQAEKEVIQLKNSIDAPVNLRTVTFDESEEYQEAEQEEIDKENEEEIEENEPEDDVEESEEQEQTEEEENEENESESEKLEEQETEEVEMIENEAQQDENETEEEHNEKGYESDDSVNWETGYRKKSLGTAKQHIDMLEEHILSLEEDIVHKDNEINELETKLQSARELVDLNNNTTVSLEVFNRYKAEKKTERSTFKDQIKTLENQLQELQENLRNAREDLREAKSDGETLKVNLETDVEEKNNVISSLEKASNELQAKISEHEIQYTKDISCYRENLLALYQNKIDAQLEDTLEKIIKLRSS